MNHLVDGELREICAEIAAEGKTEQQWAEIEASDWFQTKNYCGGFDASDVRFAFTVSIAEGQFCFSLSLADAYAIAEGRKVSIDVEPSPWS